MFRTLSACVEYQYRDETNPLPVARPSTPSGQVSRLLFSLYTPRGQMRPLPSKASATCVQGLVQLDLFINKPLCYLCAGTGACWLYRWVYLRRCPSWRWVRARTARRRGCWTSGPSPPAPLWAACWRPSTPWAGRTLWRPFCPAAASTGSKWFLRPQINSYDANFLCKMSNIHICLPFKLS